MTVPPQLYDMCDAHGKNKIQSDYWYLSMLPRGRRSMHVITLLGSQPSRVICCLNTGPKQAEKGNEII
jgi:hypothetical protein